MKVIELLYQIKSKFHGKFLNQIDEKFPRNWRINPLNNGLKVEVDLDTSSEKLLVVYFITSDNMAPDQLYFSYAYIDIDGEVVYLE